MIRLRAVLLFPVVLLSACGSAESGPPAPLVAIMEGTGGTFVFLDMKEKTPLVINRARAAQRFSPCSTFKIPHTLIALETGVAQGPQTAIPWDPRKYPEEEWWKEVLAPAGMHWNRDHTLRTAFRQSCVWYFRETAKKIGAGRMQRYVDAFDYGNRDISSGIDSFWLQGSLRISAQEQVAFLSRLVRRELGVSDDAMAAALQVFMAEEKHGATLYAKTGGGSDIGWYVGFIIRGSDTFLFAFNMPGPFAQTAKKRVDVSLRLLEELGAW
jgi:beta-lactamase class D